MDNRVAVLRRLRTLGLDLGFTWSPSSTGRRHDGGTEQTARMHLDSIRRELIDPALCDIVSLGQRVFD